MKVEVDIDSARIMKGVMDGCSTKQIEDQIIKGAIDTVKRRLTDEAIRKLGLAGFFDETYNHIEREARKKAADEVTKSILERIKKSGYIKNLLNHDSFYDAMSQLVYCAIEEYLDDNKIKIDISLNGKKQKIRG